MTRGDDNVDDDDYDNDDDSKKLNVLTFDWLRTLWRISLFCYQEKDLKQYMDDCGGIMSMNNVRVSERTFFLVQPPSPITTQ